MTERQQKIANYAFILGNLDRGSTTNFVGPSGLPETIHEALQDLTVLIALEISNPGGS